MISMFRRPLKGDCLACGMLLRDMLTWGEWEGSTHLLKYIQKVLNM